jgi:phosphoglycolate phosphatase
MRRPHTRPLAIFDVDGTLVDSRASIFEAATEASRALGLADPAYDRVRQIVGLSLPDAMQALEPTLTDAELADFVAAFQGSFRRMFDAGHEEPLYDGAMDLLNRLKADGWRLSMATGQNRRGVARNMGRPGWADLFTSTHCAEDGPGKPDPAMLLAAMAACEGTTETAIMIGDTAHDATMAANAGIAAIGVGWGFHTVEEQQAAGVRHVAVDFADLETHLHAFAAEVPQSLKRQTAR